MAFNLGRGERHPDWRLWSICLLLFVDRGSHTLYGMIWNRLICRCIGIVIEVCKIITTTASPGISSYIEELNIDGTQPCIMNKRKRYGGLKIFKSIIIPRESQMLVHSEESSPA